MYDPLQLPAPKGFGYAGELRAPGDFDFAYQMGQTPYIDVPNPDEVRSELEYGYPSFEMPETFQIFFASGDRQVVGDLIRIVNGEESNLEVSPGVAQYLLDQWGYPNSFDAWSAEEWEAQLAMNQPVNPLEGLGYTDDAFGE